MKYLLLIIYTALFALLFRCTPLDIDPQTVILTGAINGSAGTNSVQIQGEILFIQGGQLDQHGHCFSGQSSLPTLADSSVNLGSISQRGVFTTSITQLAEGQTYFARAYALIGSDTIYGGEVLTFQTSTRSSLITSASVNTSGVANIDTNSATLGGALIGPGLQTIDSYGHRWGLNSGNLDNEIVSTERIQNDQNFVFTNNITGLIPDTTYFVRAFVVNESGTFTGTLQSFKTLK